MSTVVRLTAEQVSEVNRALYNEDHLERERRLLDSRLSIIRFLSMTLFVLSVLSLAGGVYTGLSSGFTETAIVNQGFTLLNGVIYLASFFLARSGSTANRIDFISHLIVCSMLLSFCVFGYITKMYPTIPPIFILIPFAAGIVGLSAKIVRVYALLGGAALVGIYLVQVTFATPAEKMTETFTNLFSWVSFYIVVCVSIVVFAGRLFRSNSQLESQAERLSNVLRILNSTTEFGVSLSRQLAQVTTELDHTSREQATSTQEQVAAVTEVTASLEELSETANQIASSANSAALSAEAAVDISNMVKDSSELAEATAQQGTEAVDHAVMSVERVRNRIELLGQRLLNLTEQTRRVGNIIDIIDEIADETHLLALNASIEAAGNIATDTTNKTTVTTTMRGERFGVIAQEIKGLSDRSREATEEVRQAISEMQGAVAAAVLVAEEGKKETAASLSRSQIAGAVITKLNEVIAESSRRADEILESVALVRTRCDEISVATGQQRSANQQILVTMRGVAQISQESAGAVAELSEAVAKVTGQIDQLNDVLTKSSASLTVGPSLEL